MSSSDDDPAPPPSRRASVLARTAIGTGWIVGWRMASRVMGLGSTLIVARLLAPGDFGLVALAYGMVVAVDALAQIDGEDAIVRAQAPSRAMYDTAYTMSLLRGIVTAAVIVLAAQPIAAFFSEPRLVHVLWALAAGAVIQGAASVGLVEYRRNMRFGMEFVAQVVPRLAGIVVTIGVALVWRSHWALVAGVLSIRTTRLVASFALHPYRPRLSFAAWHELIGFSSWNWGIAVAGLVRSRIDSFVLGRVMDSTAVGVFAIGEEVAGLPTTELVEPLCRAAYSGFTAARDAGESMAETYLRAAAFAFLLTLPAGIGISAVADPLVRLAVGAQWLAAIPVIAIMGPVGALSVFGYLASVLFGVHALLPRQLAVTVVSLVVRVALLLPLVAYAGVTGAAVAAAAGFALEQVAMSVLAYRRFGLSVGMVMRRCWRIALAAGGMVGVLWATGLGWGVTSGEPVVPLLAASGVGAIVYGVGLLGLWVVSGRPAGAEADLLAAARHGWGRIARR